ncbi:MAG: RagB/SusD family nutrient uptake outer membrane protein [Bacteroidales bacterium]|nr:RagB/SusD family nutrient uptake outer membrane protein [Bacteroidales bacterium]
MFKRISIIAGFAILGIVQSCTDLDEKLYDTVLKDNYYKTEAEVIAAVAPAYADLRGIGDTWEMSSHCTDQTLVPTRGRHWYNGGHMQRIHEHTWTSETPQFDGLWGYGFDRVNKANQLIFQLEQLTNFDAKLKAQFFAELKILRAFGYYWLIDYFGNVPIVDRFDVPKGYMPANDPDFATGRKKVFEFIEKDIKDNIASLSDKKDPTTYGRFNKWAASAMLAKLYINAQTWTGTSKWDECIAACDVIINQGGFELEGNIFNNFLAKNEGSKENIFVIPYDETRTDWGLLFYWQGHHYAVQKKYNTANGPWNGFCALPSFIKSFNPADRRLNGWLIGKQYSSTGEILKCSEESAPNPLELTVDFKNIFDPEDKTVYNHTNAKEYFGARFVKYEIAALPSWCMGNDLAVYRYADILMLKAEALMRKNGGVATQEAVNLVNQVRSRSFETDPSPYTTATLTLDALLQERGWEFYHEGMRRNDLVRFGKFIKGTWEFFDRSGEQEYRNTFPIPQLKINANPN